MPSASSQGTPRKTSPRETGTRQRILDGALVVFGRYGYRQTSMEAVAEEVGLSRQALYRHFAAKEALFAAVVGSLHENALRAAREAVAAARVAHADAAGVIAAQLDARSVHILSRLQGSAHAAELAEENGRRCSAIAADVGRRFAGELATTIEEETRGRRLALAPGLPASELAEYLIVSTHGLKESGLPLERYRRDLARLVRLIVTGAERAGSLAPKRPKPVRGRAPSRRGRAG
ncbi:MAG TPA: helix-turn-helix domain-containing protein [Myxococcota bacterium]|jgi:AcrR family transcriptional regulator|nr:helix-turn-helix domain-containing protein [Myxococcota bacterium]